LDFKSRDVQTKLGRDAAEAVCGATVRYVPDYLTKNYALPNFPVDILPRSVLVNQATEKVSDFNVPKGGWHNADEAAVGALL
jgi:hypothetical protein